MAKGNETTTKFKVDISELKKSMQEAKKQVAYANSEFKAVSSSMDDWGKSSDGISAKLKQLKSNLNAQESVLAEYEKALEEVKKEYGENSDEAREYATKLNNQKAVVNKIRKEIGGYEDALEGLNNAQEELTDSADDMADSVADVGKKAEASGEGFTVLKGAVASFVGDALSGLVSTLKESITSLVTFGDEVDKALNSFQASTGATAEEMAEFEDTMKSIYNGNYGESFEDIATAMGQVKSMAGDIGADELEDMTTKAIIFRDTFDFEVPESMRAVNALMKQFGLTSDEAFNLMSQGAQSGLNQNGDLLDVINEYSVHFERAGYSADEMFNMLANGVDTGTWSVDKLGDAFKEFNIRMSDGSAKDAVEALGFSWEGLSEAWEAGGEDAKEVFNLLLNEMDGLENSTDGYAIGVGLLGTMFEDLGFDALYALSQTEGEISATKDSMDEINAIKYDSVGESLQGIGRNLQTSLLMPLSDKLLPIVSDLAVKFSEWLNDPATQESIQTLTDNIATFVDDGLLAVKDAIQWIKDNKDDVISGLYAIGAGFVAFNVASMIMGVVKAFKAFKTANEGATVAQWLLNTAMSANPIGIIVTLVATIVTALITFIATNEDARAKIGEVWDAIKEKISGFVESIKTFFTETIPEFFRSFIDWIKSNWKNLLLIFINPFAGLFKYFYDNNGKFKEFVDNAIKFIKQLPSKIWTWLVNVINKVTQWRDDMKEKAKETASNFIDKVVEYVKKLPAKVWAWFVNVVEKVRQLKNDLGAKAKEAGQELLDKLIEKVKEIPEKIKSTGADIVSGLWDGISDKVSWLKEKISGFVGNVTDWLKEFFKIGSPSRLMADEVGKWLPEGIAVGITKNAKSTLKAMKNLAMDTVGSARAGLSTGTAVSGGSGGVVNNFTQVINSPKQLNRLDIYRQSKNLIRYAGGGF